MSRTLNVRPAAAKDIAEAYRWYEGQQEGLGAQFLNAVERSFQRIAGKPEHSHGAARIRRVPAP